MDDKYIKKIMEDCLLPDSCDNISLKETHISWIILCDNFVFKIKKPVQFSFLDYSTLEQREFFCREEVRLNRRLEPDMYMGVLPINQNLGIEEKGFEGNVIDYTVKMQRLDDSLEMAGLLKKDKVTRSHIDKIARKLAHFHRKAQVVKNAFNTLSFQEKYADILKHENTISEFLGDRIAEEIKTCVQASFDYLNAGRSYSNERVISGFRKDCHGDLNVYNIFLYDEPVIFDCIDFNSEYRHIDVLNDIAFLCVDLDYFGKTELSNTFYQKYLEYFDMEETPRSLDLFQYYKSYRANVHAKVALIKAKENAGENESDLKEARLYIDLMTGYMNRINQ